MLINTQASFLQDIKLHMFTKVRPTIFLLFISFYVFIKVERNQTHSLILFFLKSKFVVRICNKFPENELMIGNKQYKNVDKN